MKKIVFLDMDGVLADFDSVVSPGDDPPEMYVPGFYRGLKVMPGAIEAVGRLINVPNIEVYIGTKQSHGYLGCASEKVEWIAVHFPRLLKKIVIACDKKLLRGDYLIDDSPKWEKSFEGTFFLFNKQDPKKHWETIATYFEKNYSKKKS